VVSPGAGNLVDQRLHAVGVLRDIQHGEIIDHRTPDQAAVRTHQRNELANCQRRRRCHQPRIASVSAQQRQYRLRAGNYRVLFELEGACLVVYNIGDRKDIYFMVFRQVWELVLLGLLGCIFML